MSTTATGSTPTPTLPTLPSAATKDTADGAIAFVRYYVDVFNYASNTGDVTQLQKLSSPTCAGCNRYIELISDTYRAGGSFRGLDWNISKPHAVRSRVSWKVNLTMASQPGEFIQKRGAPPRVTKAEHSSLEFLAEGTDSHRQITRFALSDGNTK